MGNNDERCIRDCKEGDQLMTQNDEFLRRLDWLKNVQSYSEKTSFLAKSILQFIVILMLL